MQLVAFYETSFKRNIAWVQLLGLCPLLAVSNDLLHSMSLALASAIVLICSASIVSLIRTFITDEVRLPVFVVVISTFTTAITILIESFSWDLYIAIALYFQIIITNCMILGRLHSVAIKSRLSEAFSDASFTALGFFVAITALAVVRELIGLIIPLAYEPVGAFIIASLLLAVVQKTSSESRKTAENFRNSAV